MDNIVRSYIGEMAALAAAFCWTFSSIAFESAGKDVGPMSVNYIRVFMAFILLSVFTFVTRGCAFPIDAARSTWFWLFISGLIGFVLGDLFLLKAFLDIGSRISLLIVSLAPPITALASFIIMGERISILGIVGIILTIYGISLVILGKNPEGEKMEFNRPLKGIMFAFLGAIGQAFGLVFGKLGIGTYNAFAATQIRLIAAIIGLTIIITTKKQWFEVKETFNHKRSIGKIAVGSALGPFIGTSLSLLAVQYTTTGVASSISSISPIIIIPVSIMVFKEKILFKEILGAIISIVGIVILFL